MDHLLTEKSHKAYSQYVDTELESDCVQLSLSEAIREFWNGGDPFDEVGKEDLHEAWNRHCQMFSRSLTGVDQWTAFSENDASSGAERHSSSSSLPRYEAQAWLRKDKPHIKKLVCLFMARIQARIEKANVQLCELHQFLEVDDDEHESKEEMHEKLHSAHV